MTSADAPRLQAAEVDGWIGAYERAWRTPGTAMLSELFSDTITYLPSPWAEPIVGLDDLAQFWERSRKGPDEGFDMTHEVVAIDGATAVVRVAVDYQTGNRWRDLWVLTLTGDGRCVAFEEWPFHPDQRDGHESA